MINRAIVSILIILMILFSYSSYCFSYNKTESGDSSCIQSASIQELNFLHRKAEESSCADTILFYSKKALDFAEKNNLDISRTLLLLGDGYIQSGDLTLALDCFTKAANIYKSQSKDVGLATTYSYISTVYNSQQNEANAIFYSKKAIEILSNIKDSIRLATAIHNLGYMYYTYEHGDSALLYLITARDTYQGMGDEIGWAYSIGNIGLVYVQQRKCEEAKQHLNEAIVKLEELNDEYAITEFMIAYSQVLQMEGDLNRAIDYALDSYELALKNNISEYKRDAAFRLSKLYEANLDYNKAYNYLTTYYTIRDSIKNLETIQQMADLRTDFEVNQKQLEVDGLLKSKTIQLIVISALLIIVILATWLIVVYRKNLHRVREFTDALNNRRKELEAQKTELKELNGVKDKFFSIISHDLRSPINSLGGISFMIKESIESDNPQLLWEVVDYIDKTTFSLSSLLDNLLNWAMFQQGKLNIELERIEMKPLVNIVVGVFSTFVISKDIRLKLSVRDDIFIYGEKNSLMTILRNLISNAIKFTEKGKEITISCNKADDNWVKLELADQGVGIPKEKLDDLFRVGKNKSTSGTENEKGLGLGLSLVHEFVALNGGRIYVESEVGVGTKFTLFLKEAVK